MRWLVLTLCFILASCAAPAAPSEEKWVVEEEPYSFPWERGIPVVVHELEDGCTQEVDCQVLPPEIAVKRFRFARERIAYGEFPDQVRYFGIEIGDLPLHVFAIPERPPDYGRTEIQSYLESGLRVRTSPNASRPLILDGPYADELEAIVEPAYVGHLENKEFISYDNYQIILNDLIVLVAPPPYTVVFWFFYDDFRTAIRAEIDTYIFRDHTVTSHRKYLIATDTSLCSHILHFDICEALRAPMRYSDPIAVDIPTLEYRYDRPD